MDHDDIARTELIGWLESKRRHVRQQVEALPPEARRTTQVPSGWTPLGLVHHLTYDVERVWLRAAIAGHSVDIPVGYEGWLAPDDLTDEEVLDAYVEECRIGTSAVAGHLDICRELVDGGQRLVLDVPS